MKIAIITLPLHTNYGGILQAYALQTVLQRMGHEVDHLQPTLDHIKLHPLWLLPLVWLKRICKNCFLSDWKVPVFKHPQLWLRQHTDAFINEYIQVRTLERNEWNTFLGSQYDAFIIGSDQVWRSAYTPTLERYFLSFLPTDLSKKRITYAASFGLEYCDFTSEQIKLCAPLLQHFDYVSVREQSGISICRNIFGKDAVQVLDPTLLLQKDDYTKLLGNTRPSKGNLLSYVLDKSPEIDAFIESVAKKMGLIPFTVISKSEDDCTKFSECQQPPIEQWLRGFEDAEFVITDSFHGCVFAIIFGKPFLCIGNISRGAERFNSLFRQFGLQHCMKSSEEFLEISSINWEYVYNCLSKMRKYSMNYLEQALK